MNPAVNRAPNDWLADYCLQGDPKRLFGAVNLVAARDVQWARDEVRRCVNQYGSKAPFLRPCHTNPEARWWNDYYDPLWATCEELDVAVSFHPFPGDESVWLGPLLRPA